MRLFVGIPLPEDVRARLGELKGGLLGARWVEPENLHLSLRFIGEVPGGDENDIDEALAGTSTVAQKTLGGPTDGVRRDDHILHRQQRIGRVYRFLFKDIQARASYLSLLQHLD